MPRYTPKRYEQVFAQMIARVVARSNLSDVSDVSVWKHVLAAAARQDDEQYYQGQLLLQLFSIDTATGDDLDERAKDIQPGTVSRISAAKATGTVVFSRAGTTGTTIIPIGTTVKTADGVVFETTTTGTITPTSVEQVAGNGVGRDSNLVSVVALVAGANGNVSAGYVVRFETKPAGVDEVTNLSVFANGYDRETDDAFRERLKAFVRGLARCQVEAIEVGVIGQTDPISGSTILFSKVIEDLIERGNVTLYVDDGTGTAEEIEDAATEIAADLIWNNTTTVTTTDTSEVAVNDWLRLDSDGQWFQVASIVPNTSITILNPGGDTIPAGSGAGASSKAIDILTEGFSPTDDALGGETRLRLDTYPIRDDLGVQLVTDVQGNLTINVDFTINPATGEIVLVNPLVTGEQVVAGYFSYVGLIAFAQKIVDGDPNDRTNFPGLRAAGVLVRVQPPQVVLQNVTAVLTVAEGYEQATAVAAAEQAIKNYINTLTISGDVIRASLIRAIMGVSGVINVDLIQPADDVIVLDEQLARTTDANLNIT